MQGCIDADIGVDYEGLALLKILQEQLALLIKGSFDAACAESPGALRLSIPYSTQEFSGGDDDPVFA